LPARRLAARRGAFETAPRLLFFINVEPGRLEDPRFVDDFSAAKLREARYRAECDRPRGDGEASHLEPRAFRRARAPFYESRRPARGGRFRSGHSSLLALVACAPRFIKLDGAVVRDIHSNSYRRHLVRALNTFAASVDSRSWRKGVEQWKSSRHFSASGVRYAQGYLFARPMAEPRQFRKR